jgi:hypothetical protein
MLKLSFILGWGGHSQGEEQDFKITVQNSWENEHTLDHSLLARHGSVLGQIVTHHLNPF